MAIPFSQLKHSTQADRFMATVLLPTLTTTQHASLLSNQSNANLDRARNLAP